MPSTGRRSLSYSAWSAAPVAALAALLGIFLSAQGVVLAGLVAIPWLAWRYDNDSGAFLIFAILFLLVLAIPALLLALLAATH